MAAFSLIGGLGHFLGALELGVGALVRLDFAHQQVGLARGFLFRDPPAFLREHEQPGADAGDDGEDEINRPQRGFEAVAVEIGIRRNLQIDQR